MTGGSVRLAVVPPALGYAGTGAALRQGRVPPQAKLFYEITLLRCQKFTIGLACCVDDKYPCIKLPPPGEGAPAPVAGLVPLS